MGATDYTVDLRDIRFVLHEQLKVAETLGQYDKYAEFDKGTYDQMVDEAAKIGVEVLAPTNRVGDREGVQFDGKGNVTTPECFKEAWNLVSQGGWFGLAADPELGGMGAPHVLETAVGDAMTGANVAFATYMGLARAAANLLAHHAVDTWWGRLCCEKLYAGQWGATMCLTEAGAGSDVGANRAKATPTGEKDVYLIEGEKVFITAGDHDLAENIVHLVLARTPGSPPGTRGLSIFMVPKYVFGKDGALGARNGVFVESIEEKMGIHGSATTTLILGAQGPCKGWLIGDEFSGMKTMFLMMNEARIGVGLQGLTGAAAAYHNAVAYANERIQGTDLDDIMEDDAPSVPIVRHPDVRRMLMWQKVHVEGMRSLIYETAMVMDKALTTDDPNERREFEGHVELMTPIIKSFCSDRGFESTILAMQTFGGYGYIGEYPVEQTARDTKISSIYEGTNGIQAMDLLGRKMRKGAGVLFMNWLNWLNAELDRCKAEGELTQDAEAMDKARDALGAAAMHLGALGMQGRLKEAMLHATPFLDLFGTVLLGYELIWQARLATAALRGQVNEADRRFYRGKILNSHFYCSQVLPRATALSKSMRASDMSCMDEDLFVV